MNSRAQPDPQPAGRTWSRPRLLPRLAATGATVVILGVLATVAIQVDRFSADPPAVDTPALPRGETVRRPAPRPPARDRASLPWAARAGA